MLKRQISLFVKARCLEAGHKRKTGVFVVEDISPATSLANKFRVLSQLSQVCWAKRLARCRFLGLEE